MFIDKLPGGEGISEMLLRCTSCREIREFIVELRNAVVPTPASHETALAPSSQE